MLQLGRNKPEHILAALEEFHASRIVDICLCFVKAFLQSVSSSSCFEARITNQGILLASRSVACVRFQKAAIEELQICFDGARRLSFAFRPQSKDKYSGKK